MNAWFGLIESFYKLKKILGLHSTFIIKNSLNYSPMKVLHAILSSRHGTHPARHWVVMQTTIDEMDLYAMSYAWSSKGVTYMVLSCGKTVMHEDAYISHFEDECGSVQRKELPR